ncbi:MAG: FAD-dependent oxidoreductase [Burkholderiales bacterium]|nr:FAD-dependent oxidoreductase [Burkholderiales bacterium]
MINIVGAGVVGLSVAWALVQRGQAVRLFDAQKPGFGASFGNSGSLSSSSVVPLATPGAALAGVRMLLDSNAPLVLRRRYLLRALPWLRQFVRVSDEATVNQVAGSLLEILGETLPAWQRVLQDIGAQDLIRHTGQLHVYASRQSLAADGFAWRLREAHGVRGERLDRDGLLAHQPGLGEHYTAGMFLPDCAAITDPHGLCQRLAEALARAGVIFVEAPVQALRPDGAIEAAGQVWPARACVVAAGAWSMRLLAPLGVRIPLETQRGYHVQRHRHEVAPGEVLRGPVVTADSKAFIVPMREGVRIGGTVEFAGLQAAPAPARFALLRASFARVFPQAPAAGGQADESTWMGHRPCLPDTLPVLGPLPGLPALWAAFGHGHLGLTMSAVTGDWLARALCGDAPAGLQRFGAGRATLGASLPTADRFSLTQTGETP